MNWCLNSSSVRDSGGGVFCGDVEMVRCTGGVLARRRSLVSNGRESSRSGGVNMRASLIVELTTL